jgi:hypothetical protein
MLTLCVCVCVRVRVCLCVLACSGPLLCIVQACFMDMFRFVVLVICVMLPFVAGLSQRFQNRTFPTNTWNTTNETFYTRNATGFDSFETFQSSGGSFMKIFVDVGEILPSFLTLESILLVPD